MLAAWLAQGPDLPGLGDKGPDDLGGLLNLCFILLLAGFGIGVLVVMVGSAAFVLAVGRYG